MWDTTTSMTFMSTIHEGLEKVNAAFVTECVQRAPQQVRGLHRLREPHQAKGLYCVMADKTTRLVIRDRQKS